MINKYLLNLKRTRYCIQVVPSSIYKLFKEANSKSDSEKSIFDWLDDKNEVDSNVQLLENDPGFPPTNLHLCTVNLS